jgi:acetolactate synthase-1/2/3 large subunit
MSETSQPASRSGGRILVDALLNNGVDTVYCVPGESYLPVLDALHDSPAIRTCVTRHEGAAANMADAYGKLTGRPGICFVTRGPGATHASIGVHTARQDSTPMILFIGQVEAAFSQREAFQEVDYQRMFGGLAKWATEIQDLRRIPEVVARAFSIAMSGRPGPVVVALPENVLFESGLAADAPSSSVVQASPARDDVATLHALLSTARRPLLVVGGSGWDDAACAGLRTFAQTFDIPVAASFRRQDLFDNRLDQYIGQVGLGISPRLAEYVRDADLVIALGTRLAEVSSGGYTLFQSPATRQTLVHVHADPDELGRVYQARLAINAGPRQFASALADLPAFDVPWKAGTLAARAAYLAHSSAQQIQPTAAGPLAPDPTKHVDLTQVVTHLSDTPATTPCGCIASIATGAGRPSWRPPAAPWATACPRPSRQSSNTPNGRSSASPAMAAS